MAFTVRTSPCFDIHPFLIDEKSGFRQRLKNKLQNFRIGNNRRGKNRSHRPDS
ncbi:Uncharacterised protein [Vibrio cholerae]|uniref:Uncharacterized protein n=1 Tax=Vibrio cholerae TaxID=666 RepID=A0A656AEX0_VIBCL|nr:Uncharacterised protein [Vibrio cholerae]CSC34443.1 Uncharacterised protein [Vibrio cholerae]CSD04082.1 Uncharacterised protein [Vibrio cholerae]CSD07191.1 Uncharacterised protein [Vibrio cholerae]CSI49237.1 Uncharacterised protein [Vibrio cholerae]